MRMDRTATIDMHFHVALLGDRWPHWGRMSERYRASFPYRFFLLAAGLDDGQVDDSALRELSAQIIEETELDRVVCLALDQ